MPKTMAGPTGKGRSSRLDVHIEPAFCEIDMGFWPTKAEFTSLYAALSLEVRLIIVAALGKETLGGVSSETGFTPAHIISTIKSDMRVGRAILIGKMCKLPSETAKTLYLEAFLETHQARRYYLEEVEKLVLTDRDHLMELSSQLTVDGDGKRGILKQIVAYGMQVKKIEDATVDAETGLELSPMVVALADPRMAFNALQELNRMDHEYGQDDKATSSVEAQADRIRRLRQSMNKVAADQALKVHAIAKKVAKRELAIIDDSGDLGDR